jgi:hypothetical protein
VKEDMSSVISLKFALQQVTVYVGLFILVPGLIGGILNIIVFTTLNTFRQTTCAFYLTFASIVGIGQMMTSLFIRILSDGFSVDPRRMPWFCKIYFFASNWCYAVWLTSICLATIDQFLSMSTYRRFSHLRFAQHFIIIASICWFIHNILLLIYWDASSGVCTVVNPNYSIYFSHFTLPVLYACLPIGVMSTFSLLAFYRARTLASRQLNIVRLSRDRQLTAMLLIHVIYNVIVLIPFTTFYIYSLNTTTTSAEQRAANALTFAVTILIEYSMFAVSDTFRKFLLF